jgi:hypothetical protein
MKTTIFAAILILVFASASPAQEKSPKAMTEGFFRLLMQNKMPDAYNQLFANSPVPKVRPEEISVLKQETETSLGAYGKILGYELIREERFGGSVFRLVYLLKSEMVPTVWQFFFYKPASDWYVLGVAFSDDADALAAMQ